MLYLFFNCEGSARFGPFQLIQFDESGKIIDQSGNVRAIQTGNDWKRTEKLRSSLMNLSKPIISPHPKLSISYRNQYITSYLTE
jgi:hypothetical protein